MTTFYIKLQIVCMLKSTYNRSSGTELDSECKHKYTYNLPGEAKSYSNNNYTLNLSWEHKNNISELVEDIVKNKTVRRTLARGDCKQCHFGQREENECKIL